MARHKKTNSLFAALGYSKSKLKLNSLAECRKKAGFTQEEVANQLGIGYRLYQHYEYEGLYFNLILVNKLALILGCTVSDIMRIPEATQKAIIASVGYPMDEIQIIGYVYEIYKGY